VNHVVGFSDIKGGVKTGLEKAMYVFKYQRKAVLVLDGSIVDDLGSRRKVAEYCSFLD
jgi:hypothetical protein